MATPESTVFFGREGTGAAQVFGHPYDVAGQYARRKEREGQINFALAQKQRADRDKKMSELLLTNPEKTFEPFNQQVIDAAQEHRKNIVTMFNKGANPDNPNFKLYNKGAWDKINDLARKGNFVKDVVTAKRKEVDANKFLDKDLLHSAINNTYMDEAGHGKKIEDVNLGDIDKVVENHPEAFKSGTYADEFLKNLGDTVFNYNRQQLQKQGIWSQDVDTKIKKGVYQADPAAADGIKRDPVTGNPVINVTPEVVRGFMGDRYAANWVKHMASKTGLSEKQVIENELAPKLDVDRRQTENLKLYPGTYSNEFGIKPKDEQKVTRRLQNVDALANAFVDDEGFVSEKPNQKAEDVLGYIKHNAKFGNADITDAHLIKGTEEPGSKKVGDVTIANAPYDRLVLMTKQGQRGRTIPREIDLSDQQSAAAEINSVFETAKTEGGFKVGHDVLLDLNEKKHGGKYFNRERNIRPGSFDEGKMNREIEKWREGSSLHTFVGKKINGKKIIDARFSSPFLGLPKIKAKLSDGSEIEIPTQDSEGLKQLQGAYKSGLNSEIKLAGKKGEQHGLNKDFWANE